MALPELGAGSLQEPDLLADQLDPLLSHTLFEAQQPLVLHQQLVPAPDGAHSSIADLDAPQRELVCSPLRPVRRVLQRIGENRLLHFGTGPVRVGILRA